MGDLNKALDDLLRLHEQWQERKSTVWGTPSGFPSIDELTGGFHNGEVFVLAARTSQGKTALSMQMAFSVIRKVAMESFDAGEQTGQVLIFSPEMAATMIMLRHTCVMSRVPSNKIRGGNASEQELASWKESVDIMRLYDPYVTLKSGIDMSVQDIEASVSAKHASGVPINLIVVDYLQYLTSMSGKDNSYEQVSSVIKSLKSMANQYDVPILALSQMNRKAASNDEEDVPELHELEGSGKIEARADTVGILWRPVRLDESPDEPHPATFAVRKNRNGPVGIARLHYIPNLTMFRDPANPDE